MHALGDELKNLVGRQCWGVIAGGIGSMATIHFGEKVRRTMPLSGIALGETMRDFQGEYCISIRGCAWRLEEPDAVVCGWREESDVIEAALLRLKGSIVTSVRLENHLFDLTVCFGNRLCLRLFCDQTGDRESMPNYSIRTPQGQFRIAPRSELVIDELV